MATVYKTINNSDITNRPINASKPADSSAIQATLGKFVELFKAKHL